MKILLVSGFLGAGKTTFIKEMAKNINLEFVVLENEYADIGVDKDFLDEKNLDVWEMSEGCICCSMKGDFKSSIKRIYSEINPEYLLIEPTGLGMLSSIIENIKELNNEDIEILRPISLIDVTSFDEYLESFNNFFLDNLKNTGAIIGDVGNNEFWLSRAYEFSENKNKILFSRSLGTMGCSIGKAIGAYYALKKNIVCFIGDQALQMNPQELQFISNNKLPIWIVVINNNSSGMIKSRQIRKYNSEFLLTTEETGYSVVNLEKLSNVYDFRYIQVESIEDIDNKLIDCDYAKPLFINFIIDENIDLEISLPIGNSCKNMEPKLSKEIYEKLNLDR